MGLAAHATNGGWELNAANIAASLALAFAGNGDYSLDKALNLQNLLARRPAPAK